MEDTIDRDIRSLQARLAELIEALERCPDWKVGSQFWLDRLEGANRIRRQIDRLESLR